MSAGKLAAKLLLSPKDITTARPVRWVSEAGSGGAAPQPGGFGDFGEDPTGPPPAPGSGPTEGGGGYQYIPGRDPFPIFAHQEDAAEQVRAGRADAATTYRCWSLLTADGGEPVDEDEDLEVAGEGILNVLGVVRRPTEGLCRIDCRRVGDAEEGDTA